MFVVRYLIGGLIYAWYCSSPALAGSIENRDPRDHSIVIIENGAAKPEHIKAGGKLDGVCVDGCVIRFSEDKNLSYRIDPGEAVAINGGYIYFIGPAMDAVEKGAPGADGKPSTPAKKG